MFLAKLWLNFTVLNVKMSTILNHHDTIIQMELILAQVFLTCSSWFIQNIGQSDLPINLCPGIVLYIVITAQLLIYYVNVLEKIYLTILLN